MKFIPIKVMASSVALAATLTTSILPSYAFADEKPTQIIQLNAISKNDLKDIMGPGNLEQAIKQAKGNVLALDVYANTLQKQPTASFSAAGSVNEQLNKSSMEHQDAARKNAAEWLDTLKPKMIQINENILDYARTIKSFSKPLNDALDQNNKKKFVLGVNKLHDKSVAHKQDVDNLIEDLKAYRKKISTDTQNLKTDTVNITSAVVGDNAEIGALKQQLAAYDVAMNSATTAIALGSTGIVTGVLLTVTGGVLLFTGAGEAFAVPVLAAGGLTLAGGIAGTALGAKQMDDIRANIKNSSTKLSTLNQEVTGLNLVNNQVQNFTKNIDQAIDALQSLSNGWGDISAKYKSLLDNTKDAVDLNNEGYESAFLESAVAAWQEIATQAGNIYVDSKYDQLKS
ncbi:HBL/NHE enterotoxin family protein [Bacillus mycoides]|uniref:HBL/NHE enterotoxin family protein n=1 Tax=Bacillus mycoides TaxID=1405 RepID=UPI003D64F4BF